MCSLSRGKSLLLVPPKQPLPHLISSGMQVGYDLAILARSVNLRFIELVATIKRYSPRQNC